MNMDILDAISELQIEQKKTQAILDGFMQEFTIAEKDRVIMSIGTHFEQFQYTAHVISDLLAASMEKTEALAKLADAAWNEQQRA